MTVLYALLSVSVRFGPLLPTDSTTSSPVLALPATNCNGLSLFLEGVKDGEAMKKVRKWGEQGREKML